MLKTGQNKDQTQKPASVCHFKSVHEMHVKAWQHEENASKEMHADSHTATTNVQLDERASRLSE